MLRAVLFDMGRVLIDFSHERMLVQMAAVCGCAVETLRQELFASGLLLDYERGELTEDELYSRIERLSGGPVDREQLDRAASDIFTDKPDMLPVLTALREQGLRLILVSNTSRNHFEFIRPRFPFVPLFDDYILSYEVRSLKPDPAIYAAAVEAAGCAVSECLFTDDLADNIAGAVSFGLQAVQFVSTPQFRADLTQLGLSLPEPA